ncbi:MAG TPA: histidine kinase dimerization/phospho-acceptor domain-containing protein, partial [Gemmatimonadaceae bacterium]|nr:histidine kinase dimerization/phospho-acceptor domain-containing protein [Gemmatimonadaceae bacterium]
MTPRRHSASGWARPALTRATLLTVLLGLTVALAGVLAYEAHQASRSQRVTAERALRDYASFAAHDFVAGAAASLDSIITGALRPAVSVRATSPYEPLGDPAVLLRAARRALPCAVPDDDGPAFAVDLGSRAVRVAGADAPRTAMAWLRDTIIVHARGSYRPGWRYAVILGQGAMRGRAAVYGVRYAEHDVPVAAYGWLTCAPAAVAPLVRAAAAGHVALPAAASAVRGDSLLALEIRDAVGATLYRSPAAAALDSSPLDPSPLAAAVTLEQLGGVTVRVALRPEAARGLVVEWPPRSRVPLLLGVLALTAGLAAIAAIQLRREHELTRLRADFTSSVSHELRTPLAQILLYAETLSLERVRSATERREAAETIVQEARRLMHMVDNVLHFARAERGGNRV